MVFKMPTINQVRNSVLKKIKPTADEESKVKQFVQELMRVAKLLTGLDCNVCGSIGKFTWIRGDHDIDLFMFFPKDATRDEMEKKGLAFGKRIAEEMRGVYKIKYAEHPYVHATISGFDVDIVPCYAIRGGEQIISAVDRSPLHLEYVISNLEPAMRDEVRLLKQFCKGIGVYGSDAKHLGFSGYICELLVLKYGSFEDVLKAASEWKAPVVLFLRKIEDLEKINTDKFPNQPLIIIDPTDHNRNAAAVVNGGNLIKFINTAKKFLAGPNANYFSPGEKKRMAKAHINKIHSRGTKFVAIKMAKPDVIDDILYPQLRKATRRIAAMLRHNEFGCLRHYEHIFHKHIYIIFELETWDLPDINQFFGPPIFSQKHSEEFLAKYRKQKNIYGPYIESNRWVVDKQREFRTAIALLRHLIKKKQETLIEEGIPKYIAEQLKKAKLIEHKEFWKLIKSEPHLSAFLYEKYFETL